VLEVPVNVSQALSEATVDAILAPIDSVLKGVKKLIMNNPFILALAALGVFLAGIVTIKIAKNKLTIVYNVGNAIKKIVLFPITATIWIGKKIKVLLYRSEVDANPTLSIDNGPPPNVPLINNGPDANPNPVVTPVAVTPVVVTPTANQIKEIQDKIQDKKEFITKIKTNLDNARKQGTTRNTPQIKKRIEEIEDGLQNAEDELDKLQTMELRLNQALNKAKGTRKRNNKKNTKKNKKRLQSKPTRKFKPRK